VNNSFRQILGSGAFAVAALCVTMAAGCSGPPKAEVTGTVTLDGVPIENGSIQFYPVGATGQTVGAGIENGKYNLISSVGEMTVTINASKVVGKHKMYETADSPVVDKLQETIPATYNTLSTLKVTLKPGKNDGVDFELKSETKK